MLKKILVFLLCLVMVCVLPATVFAQTQDSGADEISSTTITEDGYIIYPADPEYMEWLLGTPDEILSSPTAELLEYFLQTPFVGQQILSVSATGGVREDEDFSLHEAYRELIARSDFVEVLESYAGSVLQGTNNDWMTVAGFEKVLIQPQVLLMVSDLVDTEKAYPNLSSTYSESANLQRSVGQYVTTINDIDYYTAGNIYTASNNRVEVCTPERELTADHAAAFNSTYDYSGNTRIAEPTAYYNCHSYAWYLYSLNNPYWIMEIDNFLDDDACSQVTSPQEKDIIVYYNSSGAPVHSGVVYSVNSSGTPTIQSKWGQGAVYRHSVSNVPATYKANGQVSVKYFRYHDYTNKYTGNNYHSGTRHYYQYADFCDICNKQINTTWTSVACSGPPCNTIMSLTPVPQIA